MPDWVIVVIVIAAVIVLAVIAFAVSKRARAKNEERQREKAIEQRNRRRTRHRDPAADGAQRQAEHAKVRPIIAVTNELRIRGTQYLLEAAIAAGASRLLAQSYTGRPMVWF